MKSSGQTGGCQQLMQGAQMKSASRLCGQRPATRHRSHGSVCSFRCCQLCRNHQVCARHCRRLPGAKTRAARWARTASGRRRRGHAQSVSAWTERRERRAWRSPRRDPVDPPPFPQRQAAQAVAWRSFGPPAAPRHPARGARSGRRPWQPGRRSRRAGQWGHRGLRRPQGQHVAAPRRRWQARRQGRRGPPFQSQVMIRRWGSSVMRQGRRRPPQEQTLVHPSFRQRVHGRAQHAGRRRWRWLPGEHLAGGPSTSPAVEVRSTGCPGLGACKRLLRSHTQAESDD